tara:strand:- start:5239 stop:6501 length:1263 start_codon:yes stop_codon:yes gene_type:complete
MSYSAGSMKTEYLDPVAFTPNQRARFELDSRKMAYLPNMRLLNLGCDNGTGAIQYNRGLGTTNLIKNCRLLDGRQEISAMRNVAPYAFFKNMNRSNDINKSNDSYFKRNDLGYEINGVDNKVEHVYSSGTSNTAASDLTDTGYQDLRELLPALNALPVLPSETFKNLILEIEFDSSALNQVVVTNNAVLTMLRPVLAVDYVDDARVAAPLVEMLTRGVSWNEIEWDNFGIPAVDTSGFQPGDTATQSKTNSSLGFRGKALSRLLIQKQFVDKGKEVNTNAVQGFGAVVSSQALLGEQTQINLNGKPIFPGVSGVTGSNEMLGVLVDAYEELQCFPGSNLYKWTKSANLTSTDLTPARGQAAWSCVEVGARVADLQVSITRTNNRDSNNRDATNAQLQINLYGEVLKVITFQNGGYSIIYA